MLDDTLLELAVRAVTEQQSADWFFGEGKLTYPEGGFVGIADSTTGDVSYLLPENWKLGGENGIISSPAQLNEYRGGWLNLGGQGGQQHYVKMVDASYYKDHPEAFDVGEDGKLLPSAALVQNIESVVLQ